MSLQDVLRDAEFVHCKKPEDFWALNDRLERSGRERRDWYCQSCKYSKLSYKDAYQTEFGYTPALVCTKFNIRVSDMDFCKYGEDELYRRLILEGAERLSEESGSESKSSGSVSSSSSGCYVATAIYGSYDCSEVWTLRRFRDGVLAKTWYGRLFIRLYYAFSPTAVSLFGGSEWFQTFFRDRLDKMVSKLQADGFESTPYQDRTW